MARTDLHAGHRRNADAVRSWLAERPSLTELRQAYPAEWNAVQRELRQALDGADPARLKAFIAQVGKPSRAGDVGSEIRREMAVAALKKICLSAATGVSEGTVRFNLVNGYVAQKLLFARALERKPVSLPRFRLLWPLLWQRRLLMPLVQPKGIYCFYSSRLIKELAALIGDRSCLEIAAGDGTLSRFLSDQGVEITATDDHSWQQVPFGPTVLREDAREALRRHRPEVVICSWPPAGNPFERHVFETPSVQLYIVIGSKHEFAAGNWVAYERQTAFTYKEDPALGRLVLPPELEPAVYMFTRQPPSS